MEKAQRSTLTDQELAERGIEIPADETDASLFNWIDNMIAEVFQEDDTAEES